MERPGDFSSLDIIEPVLQKLGSIEVRYVEGAAVAQWEMRASDWRVVVNDDRPHALARLFEMAASVVIQAGTAEFTK